MIKKKAAYSVSIVNRLTLWMFCLGIIALLALFVSTRIAHETTGSAYMINQLGLLRMKNYQLLSQVPLQKQQENHIELFPNSLLTKQHQELLARYHLLEDFKHLQYEWQNNLVLKIEKAQQVTDVSLDVERYVDKIDALVKAIDQKTEQQILKISQIQIFFIIIILFFLMIQFFYLRHYLLKPWKQLIAMADAITNHDFSRRFQFKKEKKDEFDLLGDTLNHMSEEIESQYQLLEQRVFEKTTELQSKNDIVMFLYNAIKQLNTALPICERFSMILLNLASLIPLTHFHIRLYESDEPDNDYHVLDTLEDTQSYCLNRNCSVCLISEKTIIGQSQRRYWYLQDTENKYGVISALEYPQTPLTLEQEELVSTLIEQMTMTVELERKIEQQKSYLLMKERSAMARELHDSIAQSLSCLKIHISCLQMQPDLESQESKQLLQTMRKDVNVAYSQLRELITTFRLRVNRTGFYASLHDLIKEFNEKLGVEITLNYHLPLQLVDSQHAIHLLQIIREALNNIYKHAKATKVSVTLEIQDSLIVSLTIEDNGVGLPDNWKKTDHYGLIIMQDRAELLQGYFNVISEPMQGTKVIISYKIQADKLHIITPTAESSLEEE